MEYLDNVIEWFENEDLVLLKYGLVLSNFVTIIFLLLFRGAKVNKKEDIKERVLIVTAHPDDEAMFFLPTIKLLIE